MIDRFNFFDIYAYLLPGLTFLGLIWLPFAIVSGSWPGADLASALFTLAAAYIAGHVLYHPASEALPTEGNGNYDPPGPPLWRASPSAPSEFLLDAGESTFPKQFKLGLANLIHERFKDDVRVNTGFDWDGDVKGRHEESSQRRLAFFLCRSALVNANVASYGQQFEGLYQLMRCLTVVFALGFAYHVGWALELWQAAAARCVVSAAALVAALAVILAAILDRWGATVMTRRLAARLAIGLLMLAMLLGPIFLRWSVDPASAISLRKSLLLAGIALMDGFAGWRCSAAYKPFSLEFAKAIYRDFYVYARTLNGAGPKPGPPPIAP